jgi:T4-like virus tail tube protein gp19
MDNPTNPSAPFPQQPTQPQQTPYEQQFQQQQQYPQQAPPATPQQPPTQAAYSPQSQNPNQYGLRVVDSLTTNEFRLEINGQIVTGVFAVSGLAPFSLKVENGKPVGINAPSLLVTKMVQQDSTLPFNAWVREAVQARGSVLPTREISIVAMDEGTETRRWVYHNAWISEVKFSDFDTALDYLVEEKITIQHGGVEEIWPQR